MKRKGLILFILILTVVNLMYLPGTAASEPTLYVSPLGSDTAAGTADAPLATLAGAKERLKTLGRGGTVCFRAGSYTLDETVSFDETDPRGVTYRAYDGETVVFTAGVPFTGFEEGAVNGVRAFYKDVGDADFNVLFNAEQMLPRPRYPETGYLTVESVDGKDVINPESKEACHRSYTAMSLRPAEVPVFRNSFDVVIRILHYWKDEMLTIDSYDPATGRMTFSRPTSMEVRKDDRCFFENVFEALNAPGEWYLDRAQGRLWYIPFEGETAAELTLWGSDTETMITVDGAEDLAFENIIFRGNGFCIPQGNVGRDLSSQAAYDATPCISFENAKNIRLTNCEFRDIAACAVYFGAAVQNAAVENCSFENIGAQAVFIRGENVPVTDAGVTKDIIVANNRISGYGRVFFNAVGILVIHANAVEVSHNEISNGYYTAISCGWVWGYAYNVTNHCRITDNLIWNIGQGWLSDMGGIYMLGVQPGTVLSGNVIHNVAADPGQGGYGGWGIYLDEGSSEMTVEKNLAFACGSDAYHLHYGKDNVIRNNIFALSADAQIRVVSRYEGHKTADFTNNIILTQDKTPTFSHMTDAKAFTAQGNILWDMTEGERVYCTKDGNYDRSMPVASAVRKKLLGENRIADPGFVAPEQFDFTLQPDAFALQNGFEAWDYNTAGTLPGSRIGVNGTGGETTYNAEAAAQTPGGSRVLFERLHGFINCLYAMLMKLLSRLGLRAR